MVTNGELKAQGVHLWVTIQENKKIIFNFGVHLEYIIYSVHIV